MGAWSRESASGVVINEENVLEIDTLLACVRVLAESIASLPAGLFNLEIGEDGNMSYTPAYDHPVFNLLALQPNPETTPFELWFQMVVDSILRGYGASQVRRTVKGRPMELWPLEAQFLTATRAPDDFRLIYLYRYWDPSKKQREVLLEADEVLVLKLFPHGGLLGTSLTRKMFNTLGGTRAVEDFAAEYFKNGSVHSGIIEVPDELSESAFRRLKKDWQETHTGTGNRHRAPLLEGGAKFNPLKLNAADTQMLESQKYRRSTLAGALRVPAHLINDLEKGTFSNIEHLDLAYVKHSLRPLLTNIAQRCQITLLNSSERKVMRVIHDLTELLQGDTVSRFTAYGLAVNAGVMNPNDCRRKERMNPYKGGDVYLVQGALRDINAPVVPNTPEGAPVGKPGTKKTTKAQAKRTLLDAVSEFLTTDNQPEPEDSPLLK